MPYSPAQSDCRPARCRASRPPKASMISSHSTAVDVSHQSFTGASTASCCVQRHKAVLLARNPDGRRPPANGGIDSQGRHAQRVQPPLRLLFGHTFTVLAKIEERAGAAGHAPIHEVVENNLDALGAEINPNRNGHQSDLPVREPGVFTAPEVDQWSTNPAWDTSSWRCRPRSSTPSSITSPGLR